jgi:hypothetical protein
MIIEMRTYTLKPGTTPDFEKAFEEDLQYRTKISPLGAFFRSDVGPLNQVIHIWPYESFAEKDRIGADARKTGHWPPKVRDFLVTQESKVFQPAPFSPPLEPRKLGNIYEIRTYTVKPGTIPNLIERWQECIEDRVKLSPLAAGWHTIYGPLNQWVHIWPYKDAGERSRIRAESQKLPNWPPKTREFILEQRNQLVIPANFSPLH